MRLVCPNCDAQYEVDDAAIPEAGRDVQCSNCGHAWFQRHPEIEAEEIAAEEVFETLVATGAGNAFAEPMMDMTGEPEFVDPPEHTPPPEPPAVQPPAIDPEPEATPQAEAPAQRKLDDSVLAVLREEAEREAAVRRAEAPQTIEMQTDMALSQPAATVVPVLPASVIAAREKFKDLSADAEELAAEEAAAKAAARPPSRRELLPDIEEINSTLRASSEPRGEGEDDALPPPIEDQRQGFRSGFVLMIILAVGLWMTYIMSPRIVAQIPASASAMEAYVSAVDKARVGVDAALQSASRSLRDLSGKGS